VGLFGQGYASMTAPSKMLEGRIVDGTLRHGGHPVLRWMAGNVAAEMDAAGNIKPSKKASTEKIDGIVALVMALGVWATANTAWSSSEIGL
jgi:phage terminase large subunit-like protein